MNLPTASFAHIWEVHQLESQPYAYIHIQEKGITLRTESLEGNSAFNCLKYVLSRIWKDELSVYVEVSPELYTIDWFKQTLGTPNYKHKIFQAVVTLSDNEPLKQHELQACEDLIETCDRYKGCSTVEKYWLEWIWFAGFSIIHLPSPYLRKFNMLLKKAVLPSLKDIKLGAFKPRSNPRTKRERRRNRPTSL